MIDRRNSKRAMHFFTGASLAQTAAKPLKSFVPLGKSCGAHGIIGMCLYE